MPIKFRCTHCNQFLGISRAQSGSVVDCPNCGRSIRVPNLDGTTAPLPKPSIDLNDSGLATALEQLASLQQGVAVDQPTASPARPATATAVAAPPPVIAVPVTAPVASPSDALASLDPVPSTRPWIEVEEQLATLAEDAPKSRPVGPPAGVTRRDLIVAASTAAAVAPLTWWLSRASRATSNVAVAVEPSAKATNPANAESAAESAPALTGRITYVTADGESRPDAGARVLIFPEHRQGSTLLSVDGFRANAAAADLQLARESMKLYGGAYVIADDHGRYGADLSSSGTYEILIISNYQSRPAGQIPADLQKSLARYFDRPQQLIGQTAYEYIHLRFTGREPAVRDQVFQRA
jgi:DNA-directed RNA polymerase subunit RPC12/RpoP